MVRRGIDKGKGWGGGGEAGGAAIRVKKLPRQHKL